LDLKEIKQIIDLMKRSDLTEFEIEEQGLKLRICREQTTRNGYHAGDSLPPFPGSDAPSAAAPVAPPTVSLAPKAEEPAKDTVLVKSPMVGTFYRAPSPDSPLFVNVGTVVGAETVVCIIEAMKVMNEIQAEVSGRVIEILVENGATVEYGQPLFKLKQG